MGFKQYPEFARGDLVDFYEKLDAKEKKIIKEFLTYIATTAGERRVKENQRTITQFRYVVGKSLNNITLNDLRAYLALLNASNKTRATKNDLKSSIKRFLKWHYPDWSKRFEDLSDIKITLGLNEEKINADSLVKKEEIEAIMNSDETWFWKTFFMTLYESALRPNELRNLTWDKVKLNSEGENLTEINVFASKTKRARSVYVQAATPYLQKLKEKQERGTTLVFPNPNPRAKKNEVMDRTTPSTWLRRASLKILGRSIHPYLLRHSRATELYVNAGISPKIAQKFLGHSKDMSEVYTHLSNKDVKEAMAKTIYKLDDLPPEKKHALQIIVEEQQKMIADLAKRLSAVEKKKD